MKGKELKVIEINRQIENKVHTLSVYAVFKDLKYGNVYTIFKDNEIDKKDTLYYASSHFKKDILVVLNVKDINKVEELVKEFTWNIVNNKENTNFEMIDLKDIEKAEIISYNTLLVKEEVIKTLDDKLIPKKEDKSLAYESLFSSSTRILIRGFTLVIMVVVAFFIVNRDVFEEPRKKVHCTFNDKEESLNANMSIEDDLYFGIESNNLYERKRKITYTFSDIETYNEYVKLGLYYKYEPIVSGSKLKYEYDESKKIFIIYEDMTTNEDYFEPTKYDEVLDRMEYYKYKCVSE